MELRIKVKAFESKLVDSASIKIVEAAKSANAKVSGPVPLPTKREVFTVLKSVHVNKKAREQFESRTHKRMIIIKDADAKLVDGLKRLELPAGVEVSVETK